MGRKPKQDLQQDGEEVVAKTTRRRKSATVADESSVEETVKPVRKRTSRAKATVVEEDDDDIVSDDAVARPVVKKRVTRKKKEEKKADSEGENAMTEEDIFNKKNEVNEEVIKLMRSNNASSAYTYLVEWHRFIHTPIKQHPTAQESLYNEHVRQIVVDAVLLGHYAQCLSSYEDKRAKEALDLFEESFALFDRFFERKRLAENESGPEAEKTRNYLSSKESQEELKEVQFAFSFTYGFLLLRYNQYEKGEEYIQRACTFNDDHAGIYYRLALFNRDRGDYERAEQYYDKCIEKLENPTLLGDFACFYMRFTKKYDRIPELFERALAIAPKHAENLYNYAVYHYEIKRDTQRAIELLESAMHEKAVDPRPASFLGTILLTMGQYDRARTFFLKAKSLGGFMTFTELSHYATAEVYCGNYEQAKEAYTQALRMHDSEKSVRAKNGEPDDSELLGNYAELLFKIYKRYTDAKALFDRSIEADPNNMTALNSYALLMAKLQEFTRADELFQRAVSAVPDNDRFKNQLKINLSSYANYLTNQRNKPEDAAPLFHKLKDLSTPPTSEEDKDYHEQFSKFIEKYPQYLQ